MKILIGLLWDINLNGLIIQWINGSTNWKNNNENTWTFAIPFDTTPCVFKNVGQFTSSGAGIYHYGFYDISPTSCKTVGSSAFTEQMGIAIGY